jgi:hypothetical protein
MLFSCRGLDPEIDQCERQVNAIQAGLKSAVYARLELPDSAYYSRGSELIAATEKGSVVMIEVSSSGEYGSLRDRFYFYSNFLILFEERKSLSRFMPPDASSPHALGIYFHQGAALGSIDYYSGKRMSRSVSLSSRSALILEKAAYLLNIVLQESR